MASTEIKTLTVGGNTYSFNDTTARASLTGKQDKLTAGSNISISGNVISATDTVYNLPAATNTSLGGVKVGSGLSITNAGVLSVTGGTGGVTKEEAVTFNHITAVASNNTSTSLQFDAADGRGYAIITVNSGTTSFYLNIITKLCTEHYILIDNYNNPNDVAVVLYAPSISGFTATTVLVPADGITVPAKHYLEMSIAAPNSSTAIITASAVLTTN